MQFLLFLRVFIVKMSCFACNDNAISERDVIDELKDQLQLLMSIYSSAAYPSIVSKEGMLIATLINEDRLGIDLTSTIAAIRAAAKHFSTILGFTGCPFMLISGDTQVFSLYSLRADYVLVFFTNKNDPEDTLDLGNKVSKEQVLQIVNNINMILRTALDETTENV